MTDPIAASNIAQQAFRAMELAPISSFADDSPEAEDARQQYPVALGMLLETNDWSFASYLVSLPPATAPEADFTIDDDLPSIYRLPADCVMLREVRPDGVAWRLDQTFLRTDEAGGIVIRYTRLVTAEAQLPAAFQTAVAYQLAVLLAPRWVGSRSKRKELKDDFAAALKEAERNDAPMASRQRYDEGSDSRSADWVSEALR